MGGGPIPYNPYLRVLSLHWTLDVRDDPELDSIPKILVLHIFLNLQVATELSGELPRILPDSVFIF